MPQTIHSQGGLPRTGFERLAFADRVIDDGYITNVTGVT